MYLEILRRPNREKLQVEGRGMQGLPIGTPPYTTQKYVLSLYIQQNVPKGCIDRLELDGVSLNFYPS